MSNVTCTGRESSIDDCFKVLYSLDQAKQLAATTDEVAGVACVFETVFEISSSSVQKYSMSSSVQPTAAGSSAQDESNGSDHPLLIALIALVGAVLMILLLFGYVKGYGVV